MKKKLVDRNKKTNIDKWDKILERISNIKINIRDIKCNLNTYEQLKIFNPHNFSEVSSKIILASALFEFLGTVVIYYEEELSLRELNYKIWIEKKKSEYDGNKAYNSEQAKERQIISRTPKSYKKKNIELIRFKAEVGRVKNSKASVEKLIWIGQTIISVIKKEKK